MTLFYAQLLEDLLKSKKKKKKKKGIDVGLGIGPVSDVRKSSRFFFVSASYTIQAPDAQAPVQAVPEVSQPLVAATDSDPTALDQEPAPDTSAIVDDFDLPLKKKRRRRVIPLLLHRIENSIQHVYISTC